jgi:hypothetical protein
MGSKAESEGLSLWYRLTYRLRYMALHVFGPAQLGEENDPHRQLKRERAARVDAARRARAARGKAR